jgi:Zn-dependent protease/CBS domain-containing protein
MQSSIRLGRVAGIEIGLHYTWLFAVIFIAWSLAVGYFPSVVPGVGAGTYWALGVAAALLLFVSVLLHELSHSLVARSRGMTVDSITLFIFGGVSNLRSEAVVARDEFLVAVVGPVSSLVLAGIFWLISQTLPGDSPLAALFSYLGFVNLLLGVFNLVPGFPLDGGRVLRSLVWGATGDMQRATLVAAYAGQAFGWLLIVWGFARLLSGDFFGGLWTAFIGWFLNSAAESMRQAQTQRQTFSGVRVASVMDPAPALAAGNLSVHDFVFEYVLQRGHRALPIVENGLLSGIVTLGDAKHLAQDAWSTTPVATIMTGAPLKTVAPDAELSVAIALMAESGLHQLPVIQDGKVVGLLGRADIVRFLQLRQELHLSTSDVSHAGPARAGVLDRPSG